MNDHKAASADPSARFDHIEYLLNSYPNVSDEQLSDMKRWFAKEASAFEVASLAGKHPVGYGQFRADHIDKFSTFEMLLVAAIACAIFAVIFLFI